MAKLDDLLVRWKLDPPTDAPVRDVWKVLEAYFAEVGWGRSSHIKARDSALIRTPGCGVTGTLDIPTIKGRRVAKVYLKAIVSAVEIIETEGSSQ